MTIARTLTALGFAPLLAIATAHGAWAQEGEATHQRGYGGYECPYGYECPSGHMRGQGHMMDYGHMGYGGPGMMGPGRMGTGYSQMPMHPGGAYGPRHGYRTPPAYGPGPRGPGYGMGPEYGAQGYGPGMMGGMMGGPMGGPGMGGMLGYGPEMQGRWSGGPGHGPRPVDPAGPDRTAPGYAGNEMGPLAIVRPLPEDLTPEQVRHMFQHRLDWGGNPNLKVGEVAEVDEDTITAEIVTQEGSLVRRFQVDRHTGAMQPAE